MAESARRRRIADTFEMQPTVDAGLVPPIEKDLLAFLVARCATCVVTKGHAPEVELTAETVGQCTGFPASEVYIALDGLEEGGFLEPDPSAERPGVRRLTAAACQAIDPAFSRPAACQFPGGGVSQS